MFGDTALSKSEVIRYFVVSLFGVALRNGVQLGVQPVLKMKLRL